MSRLSLGALSISLLCHGGLFLLLCTRLEKTVTLSVPPAPEKIIQAEAISETLLRAEVERLAQAEASKRAEEEARLLALQQKEKAIQQQRQKEEASLKTLKQQQETLSKQMEEQRASYEKQQKAQQEKQKAEAAALKKLQQEKEKLLLAQQEAEKARKEAEKAAEKEKEAQRKARALEALRMRQDQITHYSLLVQNKVNQHWRQPVGVDFKGLACKVSVKLLSSGEVIDIHVVESSGNVAFDRSTELAIRKASPLPISSDPEVAREFQQFTFTFRPETA